MIATAVLDASALLAFLQGESGSDVVREALDERCAISVVNLAEVLSKGAENGAEPAGLMDQLAELADRLVPIPPVPADAVVIAELRAPTREAGLSLADRACMALARRLEVPALTADRSWAELGLEGVAVRMIR